MNSEKSSSSVDEIQCSIDKMLLLVFESMRNCAFPQALDNSRWLYYLWWLYMKDNYYCLFGSVYLLLLTTTSTLQQKLWYLGDDRSDDVIVSSFVLLIHKNVLNSASSESSTLAVEVVSAYEITASAIDNLLGIDNSPQEQLDQLVNYSNEYKIIKGRVLKLEEDLVSLHTDINQRVNEVGFDSNTK